MCTKYLFTHILLPFYNIIMCSPPHSHSHLFPYVPPTCYPYRTPDTTRCTFSWYATKPWRRGTAVAGDARPSSLLAGVSV